MSLSQKNLSSIQKAGQAVHAASEAISAAVLEQAQGMVARLTSQPFGAESDQTIARFKALSSLSQGLVAVESQLQNLYAMAGDLASPASDVIVLPSITKRKSITNAAAVDVVAKPAKATKKAKQGRNKPTSFTSNDTKLLAFLQGALKANESTTLTGLQMSAGAKLPLGSVGVSLKKILASGAVKIVGRGTYLLGTVASVSPAPEATPVPAKKSKAASKKAKPAAVEVPTAKTVKPKAAKKVKPAPAKAAKAAVQTAPVVKAAKKARAPKAAVATPAEAAPAAPAEDQAALV